MAAYFSVKFYIYKKINANLSEKIEFSDLRLGLAPLNLRVDNLKNIKIKSDNLVSFKKVSLEIPFQSPFRDKLETNLYIHKPRVVLNEDILKKGDGESKPLDLPVEFNHINIIDGEIIFNGDKIHANLVDFDLMSYTSAGKTMYKITSPHLKIIFPLSGGMVKLEGGLNCELKRLKISWKVSDFTWNTEDLRFNLRGRIFNNGTVALTADVMGTPDKILYPVLKNLRPLGYMEVSARVRRKQKETLFVEGNVQANKFTIAGTGFDNLKGKVGWNSLNKAVTANLDFEDALGTPHLHVFSQPGLTTVKGGAISARQLTGVIGIDNVLPLGGIVESADVKIEQGIISGTGVLKRAPQTTDNTFNAAGDISFAYDSEKKSVAFTGDNLFLEFGFLKRLEGYTDPTRHVNLSVVTSGSVNQLGMLDKYTKFYIDLDFAQWKLNGGTGTLSMDMKRKGNLYYLESDIDINHFTTGTEHINSLKGHLSTEKSITRGNFTIADTDINGKASILVDKKYFTMDFTDVSGEFKKMLRVLEIDLKLTGKGTGRFHLLKKSGESVPLVTGEFESRRIDFYGYVFDDLSGKLEYKGYSQLKDLKYKYNDGVGTAGIYLDYAQEIYRIDGHCDGIDVNRLNPEFKGSANVVFNGAGSFWRNPIHLKYQTGDLHFYTDRTFKVKGTGNVYTDFEDFRIDLEGNLLNQSKQSPYAFSLNSSHNRYTGLFKLAPTDIDLLIPWGNNNGTFSLEGSISGNNSDDLKFEGLALLEGKVFSFPNFPHELENFRGDITFQDLDFRLRSLTGTIGEGNVESNGRLLIRNNRLEDLSVIFTGKKMNLFLLDRTSFTANADLTLKLKKETNKLVLAGTLTALSGRWEREADEGISFNTDPSLSSSGSKLLDRLEFDLRMLGRNNIVLQNSLGRATGKFDLLFQGTTDFPILTGTIDSRQGEIYFSDKKFDLIKARMVFNDRFQIDPIINIESESFVKDYRIKFNIKGRSSLFKPELTSSPPLPYRDILTLITLGELFERPTSDDLASRLDSGTTGLIASQLTAQIKKRTKKIFGNYMLKIDPNISNIAGASFEDSSRLIVGKEISKDLMVVYSTNFSAEQQKQIIYLQYQLTPSISLIGMVNEKGTYSLDLRFRKRH